MQDIGDRGVTHKVALRFDQGRCDVHEYSGQVGVPIGKEEESGLGETTVPEVFDFGAECEKVLIHIEGCKNPSTAGEFVLAWNRCVPLAANSKYRVRINKESDMDGPRRRR